MVTPEWRREATEWLDARLVEARIERTGQVEQPHLRPWATVLRAPTEHGDVWLKASARETAFEPRLYRILVEVVPESVLTPIAIDVPDMRPEAMPARFDEALATVSGHVDGADAATKETYSRLEQLRPTYASWCERLAEAPGSPSIDHNDLHPENILIAEDGAVRFYDWGDAVVAHPFASMMLPLGYAQERLGRSVVQAVRDSYLAAFSDLASHDELVETVELACTVTKPARALTWKRALTAAGPEESERYAHAPLRALGSIFEGPYLFG